MRLQYRPVPSIVKTTAEGKHLQKNIPFQESPSAASSTAIRADFSYN
jgi:hypothetical protein